MQRALIGLGVGGILLCVVAGLLTGSGIESPISNQEASSPPRLAPLTVSAGRGSGGFALTNREPVAISDCTVSVLDQGDDEWSGIIGDALAPYQTGQIPWSAFSLRGQPMPSYIGRTRRYFRVSCVDGSGARRSAGIAF